MLCGLMPKIACHIIWHFYCVVHSMMFFFVFLLYDHFIVIVLWYFVCHLFSLLWLVVIYIFFLYDWSQTKLCETVCGKIPFFQFFFSKIRVSIICHNICQKLNLEIFIIFFLLSYGLGQCAHSLNLFQELNMEIFINHTVATEGQCAALCIV